MRRRELLGFLALVVGAYGAGWLAAQIGAPINVALAIGLGTMVVGLFLCELGAALWALAASWLEEDVEVSLDEAQRDRARRIVELQRRRRNGPGEAA